MFASYFKALLRNVELHSDEDVMEFFVTYLILREEAKEVDADEEEELVNKKVEHRRLEKMVRGHSLFPCF